MSRIKSHILFLVAALLLPFSWGDAGSAGSNEHQRNALYLYNFLLFVDWPDTPVEDKEIIRVAIAGDGPMLTEFSNLLPKKPGQRRDIVVTRTASVEELVLPCHVLFIGRSQCRMAPRYIEKVQGRPVLTISDIPNFTNMGGMVWFKGTPSEEGKGEPPKRFEINLSAVERSGIRIRSRLLRLSDIVTPMHSGDDGEGDR